LKPAAFLGNLPLGRVARGFLPKQGPHGGLKGRNGGGVGHII